MKLNLLMFLFLFFAFTIVNAQEIDIVPKTPYVNDSVYIIFEWRAPTNLEDFNLTITSDTIDFKNTTLYYAGVAKDTLIFNIFEGTAKYPGTNYITIDMSYYVDGTKITKTITKNIYVQKPKVIIKYVPKYIYVNVTKYINTSKYENNTSLVKEKNNNTNIIEENISTNIQKEKNSTNNYTTTNTNTTESSGITPMTILYGIIGLILGFGATYMFIYIMKL
ncbi:hypothetical protein ACPB8Q_04035 [Methanocaldococcus indicus]|uniref:hypothetical protein n=1 Tax=Methanocaldococcus indicus TaxID=213231 RepID=UPI003C6CDF12